MKTALVEIKTGNVVEVLGDQAEKVSIPGVGSVSPVVVGWSGGGELSYLRDENDKEFAVVGPSRFAIMAVTDAEPAPEGQQIASLSYRVDGGAVIETATYETPPQRQQPSAAEKLQQSGLTIEELKSLLGL